jgi:hypothetical protein
MIAPHRRRRAEVPLPALDPGEPALPHDAPPVVPGPGRREPPARAQIDARSLVAAEAWALSTY